jgi:hypothetical protein
VKAHHAKFLEMAKESVINAHGAWQAQFDADDPVAGSLCIGVLSGTGHGDHMRAVAFCNALRGAHPNAHIFLVTCMTGTMVEFDICHNAKVMGIIDSFVPMQQVPRELTIHHLRDQFDVLFDVMPYPVGTYSNDVDLSVQVEANARLAPFSVMYSGHPQLYMLLKHKPMTQWEIMSMTSGYTVSELDLIPLTELSPLPEGDPGVFAAHAGSDNWSKAKLKDVPRYVTVHNGAGEGRTTKCAPPDMFPAIVARLKADGVRCVQVGVPDESKIKGVIDRRGLRVPLTARLMTGAICHVDVEGFLPYVAAGLGVPSVVLFGPTPPHVFGMCQNKNFINLVDSRTGQRVQCPVGNCFWAGENWSAQCPLPERGNPRLPHCQNFVSPDEAAQGVAKFVKEREEMVA